MSAYYIYMYVCFNTRVIANAGNNMHLTLLLILLSRVKKKKKRTIKCKTIYILNIQEYVLRYKGLTTKIDLIFSD